MNVEQNKQLMRAIGVWARARGKPKPTTEAGWKLLVAEFLANNMTPDGHMSDPHEQAAWHEVPDEHPTHLVDDGATVQIADELHEGPFEDDFNRLLRDRAAAAVGPNGELLDDFDQEFQLMGKAQQALIDKAPFSRTNPVSVLNGSLGGQKIFSVPQELNEYHQVAYWTGDDAETMPVTVSLVNKGRIDVVGFATVESVAVDARVRFGTKGYAAEVEVDVNNGCQFTVSGSEVAVSLRSNAPVIASAFLSFRQITHQVPITRTIQIATGSLVVTVPTFAKSVTVWRQPVANGVTLNFQDTAGNTRYSYLLAASQYDLDPIPLGNEIKQITVVDTGGGGISAGSALIFNLAL